MNSFATVDRAYPFNGGSYASKKQPSAAAQATGFKPTYINDSGVLVPGDPVDAAELNYIFNDLYEQAANIDRILTAKGK
ncbi:hypothetical protein [Enterobacter chengduensis]|uniref:hypothetical protein n=1 Tax=Enterobacter chengduensis TaxID=2494701 RepID=UPI0005EE1ED2|nr:hypothetical protein [Enterobacter chengduensis]KJM02313.1 hypothetical protein SS39_11065 [Enterobacter chengduensis]KJM07619.1 hypothetical protein SS50_02370 [Enterobacter chengduensis]